MHVLHVVVSFVWLMCYVHNNVVPLIVNIVIMLMAIVQAKCALQVVGTIISCYVPVLKTKSVWRSLIGHAAQSKSC